MVFASIVNISFLTMISVMFCQKIFYKGMTECRLIFVFGNLFFSKLSVISFIRRIKYIRFQISASANIIIFRYNRVRDESVNVSVCGVRYDQKFCKEISYVTFILHDHWFKLRNFLCHSKSVCDIRFDCLLA